MSIQETMEFRYRQVSLRLPAAVTGCAQKLRDRVVASLQRRLTERVLARLDASTLEDIGVPHEHVSPSAGPLERYPTVISVRIGRTC